MGKKGKVLIIIIITVVIVLGIAIPKLSYTSQYEVPEGVWYEIIALVDNPIEKVIVLGYESMVEDSDDSTYHIEVKTIFGLTYADINATANGSYIERRLPFLN